MVTMVAHLQHMQTFDLVSFSFCFESLLRIILTLEKYKSFKCFKGKSYTTNKVDFNEFLSIKLNVSGFEQSYSQFYTSYM